MRDIVRYAVSGGLAGTANGLFGAGGGMLLAPLLIRWCGLEDKRAFATSISIILPLCLVSIAVYFFRGSIDLRQAAPYLIGGFFGGLLGGKLLRRAAVRWLHRALGLIILYGGLRALLG